MSRRRTAGVPPGQVGEVCMRGLNVMSRYLGNDDATGEAFRGGWFHSQDPGFRVEANGRDFFTLTGRVKNIAEVAGETVSLDEMDRALRALPQVRDAACVALPERFIALDRIPRTPAGKVLRPELRTVLQHREAQAIGPA
ncbi:hypothetical protein [Lentzea sp. NPDC060358]|uniref:hypothetical protein n=1 Tax=Lentzea sp. NPDC060358 TaxID=3347103 RepID=UPI003656C403